MRTTRRARRIRSSAEMDRLEAHVQRKADSHARHLSPVIHPLRIALWTHADYGSIRTPGRTAFFHAQGKRHYLGYNPVNKFIELRAGGTRGAVLEELTGKESSRFIDRMFSALN